MDVIVGMLHVFHCANMHVSGLMKQLTPGWKNGKERG